MQPGAKPKPAHLKIVTGNPGKRPVNVEPTSPELGKPPAGLSAPHKAAWLELVKSAPNGVLKHADSQLLELTAKLLCQMRDADEVSANLATQLRQCLGELGMTPSARARLAVAPPKAVNPFDDI